MYALETLTGPSAEPLSIERAKTHLKIDHGDFDDWIRGAIAAARILTEKHTGRRWMPQTLRLTIDDWPECLDPLDPLHDENGRIRIPVEPVSAITAVKYLDEDKVERTVDDSLLDTWLGHSPPLVACTTAWPSVGDWMGAVRVDFEAGYADAAAVPELVRTAMLLCIGQWEQEPGGNLNTLTATGLPPAAKAFLDLMWTGAQR